MATLPFTLSDTLGGDATVSTAATPSTAAADAGATLPRDLLLDETGDLDLSTGDLQHTSGQAAIGQALEMGYAQSKGEWYLDLDTGYDLFGIILGDGVSLQDKQEEARRVALETDGVVSVSALDVSFDAATRELTTSVTSVTDFGEIETQVRSPA